jgi:hypothetical protein
MGLEDFSAPLLRGYGGPLILAAGGRLLAGGGGGWTPTRVGSEGRLYFCGPHSWGWPHQRPGASAREGPLRSAGSRPSASFHVSAFLTFAASLQQSFGPADFGPGEGDFSRFGPSPPLPARSLAAGRLALAVWCWREPAPPRTSQARQPVLGLQRVQPWSGSGCSSPLWGSVPFPLFSVLVNAPGLPFS